jgi:carbon monoxide dehydrogenase subunit G
MQYDVHAPPSAVWEVLMDPDYVPKLYPDVVSVVADPPGRTVVGQRFHITGKAGRRRLEIFAESVELVTEKKAVTRNLPGGLFTSFESIVLLEAKGANTIVRVTFQYELSMGYLGKVFNLLLLERLVKDNLKSYTHNLKDICELTPVEAQVL